MQLRLQPHNKPLPTPDGWLIRGEAPADWLGVLAHSGILLSEARLYAIPGIEANSILGCLVTGGGSCNRRLLPATPLMLHSGCLFIPEYTEVYPAVTEAELTALLRDQLYLLHPEAGLVALGQPLCLEDLITLPAEEPVTITVPAKPVFIPSTIRSFEVQAAPPEEAVQALAQALHPGQKQFEDKPLSTLEQLKLGLYRQLFGSNNVGNAEASGREGLLKKLEALFGGMGLQDSKAIAKLQEDFEDLERRNSSEVDKLLELIKNNPDEALKYAIPLGEGTERGEPGAFQLSRRWSSFSLFGNAGNARGSGTVSILDDHQARLRQEYTRMAEAHKAGGDYERAAFIYLKLLKDYRLAAQTLEQAGRYADASSIYLKYCRDKVAAAASYAKGNMLSAAIDLYIELGRHEEAGDLYQRLSDELAANKCYQKVVDGYIEKSQFLKAATLQSGKMRDTASAQALLLRGWRSGKDAYNCLHVYFSNIANHDELALAIKNIYSQDTVAYNARDFLKALKSEFARSEQLAALARDIATDLIATYAGKDAGIVSELRTFYKRNILIDRDILRYRAGRKNK